MEQERKKKKNILLRHSTLNNYSPAECVRTWVFVCVSLQLFTFDLGGCRAGTFT